jgi:hypothetical protein
VHARLEEAAARWVLRAEDAAPHRWETASSRRGRWSWLEVPWLAGSSVCGSRRFRGYGPGQEVFVLETRWLRWCLVAVDKRREERSILGAVW